MSKKFRKAVASIAAAALCAVSAMSTTINADAAKVNNTFKYTYRHMYAARTTSSGITIKNIKLTYKVQDKYALGPLTLLDTGRFNGSFSSGGGYETYTGSWAPNKTYSKDGKVLFSMSTYAKSTDFTYKNSVINMSITGTFPKYYPQTQFFDPFLVGDLNGDKQINNTDKQIFEKAKNPDSGYEKVLNKNLLSNIKVKLPNGKDATIEVYKFDINNDGKITDADLSLLTNHLSGGNYNGVRFDS